MLRKLTKGCKITSSTCKTNRFIPFGCMAYLNRLKKIKKHRRDKMIFKVLYQELLDEVPVREHTKSMYIEANSVQEVRKKLIDRNYNIEYIQELDEAHLNYEKQSPKFELENV